MQQTNVELAVLIGSEILEIRKLLPSAGSRAQILRAQGALGKTKKSS
jgi:hypothetical protein